MQVKLCYCGKPITWSTHGHVKYCSNRCRFRLNHQLKEQRHPMYGMFRPPHDWDKLLESREYSWYYQLLVKSEGQERADMFWNMREIGEDSINEIYQAVKNYKPRNELNLIGDLAWGFNNIKQ